MMTPEQRRVDAAAKRAAAEKLLQEADAEDTVTMAPTSAPVPSFLLKKAAMQAPKPVAPVTVAPAASTTKQPSVLETMKAVYNFMKGRKQ
jgi:hypothetical protein